MGKAEKFFVHWHAVRTIVENEDFRFDLNAFDKFLNEAKAAEVNHNNPTFSSVWGWALDRFRGDTQRAFRFLMVFTLDTIASSYRSYDPDLQWFFQAWGSVSAVRTGSYERAPSRIHFPNRDNNERFPQPYHYWNAAYLSSELVALGSEPISAAFIGSLTGIIYERLVFRMNALRLRKEIDRNFWQALMAVPLEDQELTGRRWIPNHDNLRGNHVYSHIAYHIVGALHGALGSSKHVPSIPSVTQFVAANYSSLKRELYPFLQAHLGRTPSQRPLPLQVFSGHPIGGSVSGMDEKGFEGSLVLEQIAAIGELYAFFDAIDSDDFSAAASLMKRAGVEESTIQLVLRKMRAADGDH